MSPATVPNDERFPCFNGLRAVAALLVVFHHTAFTTAFELRGVRIPFTDHTVPVDAHVNVGNLVVILPPNVDVDVSAKVDGGSADVLGQHWDGLGNDERQLHDNGADGVGGGTLQLTASVDLGKLEVRR